MKRMNQNKIDAIATDLDALIISSGMAYSEVERVIKTEHKPTDEEWEAGQKLWSSFYGEAL